MQESPGVAGVDGSYGSNVPAFLTKLWTLVEDPDTNHLICWSAQTGTSFHVFDQGRFAKEVLPKYFKHNNMASFVRQLNMGFRKVVNIEQSGLVKPERDDTEFQHLYFLQGHEHMLEHIKRKQVSIVKSEETKVRQEDLSKLLYEVQLLRTQQDNMECQMQDMKQNEVLWREVVSLRQNHTQQQKVMNKLIQFLFSQMQSSTPSAVGLKRKPLMLDDGSPSPPAPKFSHSHPIEPVHESYYIHSQPSSDTASCSTDGLTGGPIISDVTDMTQASMAIQMQSADNEKSMMLIKEEPVSPGVRGGGKGGGADGGEAAAMASTCQVCSSEPPVLPVAMVQSVLEGRGSVASMVERRNRRPALDAELPESVENVDMSLEELQQLLLRSHQQSAMEAGAGGVMDPFSLSLPLTEWNFTEMESNLKSVFPQYMFQNQEAEAFPAASCEDQ
uniref:Heat shock transcription factor 4 n=1 Tax=Poecilia latipinna TaxID=48699 RepID=A0A3B3TSG7_9TELE